MSNLEKNLSILFPVEEAGKKTILQKRSSDKELLSSAIKALVESLDSKNPNPRAFHKALGNLVAVNATIGQKYHRLGKDGYFLKGKLFTLYKLYKATTPETFTFGRTAKDVPIALKEIFSGQALTEWEKRISK